VDRPVSGRLARGGSALAGESLAPRGTLNPADGIRSAVTDDTVELALDLLAHLEHDELSLAEVVDRIETVTTNPSLTRDILDEAERRDILEREDGRIRVRRGGTFVRFESQVVTREGEFECRRCGASLSTGHFVQFESGELGPFGSSCIRKVTGRE
jgi:hypothetical protein